MIRCQGTLLCWHAERAGIEFLEHAVKALRNRGIEVTRVLYLVQARRERALPERVDVKIIEVPRDNPTRHTEIYAPFGSGCCRACARSQAHCTSTSHLAHRRCTASG